MTAAGSRHHEHVEALAELVVAFGANLQPGQILAISSEPGKEDLARTIAESAYRRGALFVDLSVFDVHLKRSRALHADPDTLRFVPPWMGARARSLGEHRCARIALTGPASPRILEGIDPALLGRDTLPSLPEAMQIIDDRTTNWTAVPCPTPAWAQLVHPELEGGEAIDRLWRDIIHICRLDEPDPIAAWNNRLDDLSAKSAALDALGLDALRFHGPGTDLTVGLLPGVRWSGGGFETKWGQRHLPNVPTEEVFTSPDPTRTEGLVTSTKPLLVSGRAVLGLKVRFEGGRAVQIDADEGADLLRELVQRDEDANRLGEVALVDQSGRIGARGTVFHDTLLDENAASHIALGAGFRHLAQDAASGEPINQSGVHTDFMIGGPELEITGRTRDGREIPVLMGERWAI